MDIRKAKADHERDLLRKANVVGVGIGLKERDGEVTDEDAISILVTRKVPEEELNQEDLVPARISEFATDVVETGEIHALAEYADRTRPVVPGYSIGHYAISAGTFGCVVYSDGEERILSNSHVLARSGRGDVGDAILQPGPYDGGSADDQVGTLELSSTVQIDTISCPAAESVESILNWCAAVVGSSHRVRVYDADPRPVNKVDAALAVPEVALDPAIEEIGEPEVSVDSEIGQTVQKTGRTTGHTVGRVTHKHVTVQVEYGAGVAWFGDQDVVVAEGDRAMSRPGDSGSVILHGRSPVGLLFAGSETHTIMNPAHYVVMALGITFTA